MARERLIDGALINVLLGAVSAIMGVILVSGPFGLLMGLIHDGEYSSLTNLGFGFLLGLGVSPVAMLCGGAAAYALHNRSLTGRLLALFTAIGIVCTMAFGALAGMLEDTEHIRELAIASAFGGLGAALSVWLYEVARRRPAWTAVLVRFG